VCVWALAVCEGWTCSKGTHEQQVWAVDLFPVIYIVCVCVHQGKSSRLAATVTPSIPWRMFSDSSSMSTVALLMLSAAAQLPPGSLHNAPSHIASNP